MKTLDIQTWIDEFNPEEINVDAIQEYLEFIKEAVKNYDSNRYSEWHHVMPKCVDKDRKYNNELAQINGADHLKAHIRLVKCFVGYKKHLLGSAVSIMCRSKVKENLTPEEYEEARRVFSESQTGELNHAYGKPNHTRNTVWITNGESNRRVSPDTELPDRWWVGDTKISSNNGLVEITDGYYNKYISPKDPIPEGWRKGSIQFKPDNSGENNPMYGKIWITNGSVNQLIPKEDIIPDGWIRGATQNNPDQHGPNSAIYGKISITNGKDNRLICPTEIIPDGWWKGQTQDHSKYGFNFNEGRIYINNGIKNRMIKKDEAIPEGWRRGMIRYKKY